MLRRTGFKQPERPPKVAAMLRPLKRPANYAMVSANDPAPKTVEHRNPHLLAMARGKPCLLRVPGICCGDRNTTVACHSNKAAHGKAGARKADDEYSVWGCWKCHAWLDTSKMPAHAKDMVFMRAHADQVLEWSRIVGDSSAKPKDRAAANLALCHLNATSERIEA